MEPPERFPPDNPPGVDEPGSQLPSFSRITLDPSVMGGKACIRDLRVTVGTVVALLAARRTPEEILKAYPYLERDDIDQCLAYAAWRLGEREVPPHNAPGWRSWEK